MSAAAALAALAVLLPVGCNLALRRAAARTGLLHTLPLLGAGWLACCLAIGTWCTALGLLVLAHPAAQPAAQVAAAGYLLWQLLARRQSCAEVNIRAVFPAALADPAVLWCAVFAFPPLGTPAPAILAAYGWFSGLMLASGLAWAARGAGFLPRRKAMRRPLRRIFLLAAGAARAR
ncbi:hypothetical protein [Pseudoduganella armeniaca]|uniref:Uncharacterized protein n=1 Tax=Pseudoduganella armeniaca TaxID=2072590 RepID=A0A2R4CBB9_9BURK|nr:hypothetical protein [Pseudoduganella armeniaca]AVR96885.1 hypothetical protein C9I28_15335 [Pseudoduganella armeniaca]